MARAPEIIDIYVNTPIDGSIDASNVVTTEAVKTFLNRQPKPRKTKDYVKITYNRNNPDACAAAVTVMIWAAHNGYKAPPKK